MSLPPGERQDVMTTIASKTKNITATRSEQQTLLGITNEVTDKAQIYYTHLAAAQKVKAIMIKNMELINLQSPKVTTIDVDEVVQLTQNLHTNFNEADGHFQEFL
jgi:hypothetical protein